MVRMKRRSAFLICLLLCVSLCGCGLRESEVSDDGSEEESYETSFPPLPVPDEPRVLIGRPLWIRDDVYAAPDFDGMSGDHEQDAVYVGTSKTVEIYGVPFTGVYEYTMATANSHPGIELRYADPTHNIFRFGVNSENQLLTWFFVLPELLPEEMREKWATSDTMPDIEELKQKSLQFMETYSALDPDEWVEQEEYRLEPHYYEHVGRYEDGFRLVFYRLKNGITTASIRFDYDTFGNLTGYSTSGLYEWKGVNIPDWPDEVYIEGALEKLRSLCSGYEYVVDIKVQTPAFDSYKRLNYIQAYDVNTIYYYMYYTFVYDDGTSRNAVSSFHYVLPEQDGNFS